MPQAFTMRTWQLRPDPIAGYHMLNIAMLKHMRPKHLHIHAVRPELGAVAFPLDTLVYDPRIKERTITSKTHNHISFSFQSCIFISLQHVPLRAAPAREIISNSQMNQLPI